MIVHGAPHTVILLLNKQILTNEGAVHVLLPLTWVTLSRPKSLVKNNVLVY